MHGEFAVRMLTRADVEQVVETDGSPPRGFVRGIMGTRTAYHAVGRQCSTVPTAVSPSVRPRLRCTFLVGEVDDAYAANCRSPIPPEYLLKASLLIALYSVCGERQFCERVQYDRLIKWFLDLNVTDPAFAASTFATNRARLMEQDGAAVFYDAVLDKARRRTLLSGALHTAQPPFNLAAVAAQPRSDHPAHAAIGSGQSATG